jgi:DNA-binding SARP family transcriptional activator/tetratricopeptide (TPR) repeat protein
LTSQLRINLLGDFDIVQGDRRVTGIENARLQSLLAYLVLHRDAPQSRAQLSYLFWLDSTEAQARANLRKQVYHLRRALPDADRFLYADNKVLQWRPDAPFTLDVADFEQAIEQAEAAERAGDSAGLQEVLEQAVALYRGDLLPACYDDWVLTERERLRQECARVLEGLVRLMEGQRAYQDAILAAQQLLRHDPLRELTYRRLMRLYALDGDRARALRTYHTCATVLQRELDVEPSTATRDAYEQLLALDSALAPQPESLVTKASLVGRDEEWTQLQRAWRSASDRRPRLMMLVGEAGIGKTRLAEELLEWAQRQGIPTANAHCYASERGLAYGPVAAWLRSPSLRETLAGLDEIWLSEIARLLPELLVERPEIPPPGPLTEGWQRQRLYQALAQPFFERRQLLLMLDDAQWCDAETLEWLPFLLHARFGPDREARRATQLLLVVTLRGGERPEEGRLETLLQELRRSRQLSEIELGPLDEAETFSLATGVAGRALDPALWPFLYRGSEGNPLFVVEMVRAGQAKGSQWIAEHGWEKARVELPLPPRVQRVIEARLAQLSPVARDLVAVAATIGREFSFDVLTQAHGADEETSVRALDELWRRRIVREQGAEAYDFSHDRIREVAYAGLSAVRRRFLHRRVAEALEAVYTADLDPVQGQIARQYEAAAEAELAIQHYAQAAAVARHLYANEEAISHLRRAMALMPECDPTAKPHPAELYEQMADLLVLGGKGEEARQAYGDALGCLRPEETLWRASLWCKIGSSWSGQSDYDPAQTSLERAMHLLGPEPTAPAPAWWQTWLDIQYARLSTLYFQARPGDMEELCRRMRPVVEEHASARQKVSFLHRQSMLEIRQLRYVPSPENLSDERMALSWAQRTDDMAVILYAEFALAFILLWSGDLQAAIGQLETTLPRAERVGDLPTQTLCLTYLAVAHRLQGDLEQSRRYTERCLERAREGGSAVYIGAAEANLGWLAYRAGDSEGAVRHGEAALVEWQSLQYPFHWLALWPLLAVALDQSRLADAVDQARAMLDPVQQRLPEALTARLEGASTAWEGGQAAPAREHLAEAVWLAQDMGYL